MMSVFSQYLGQTLSGPRLDFIRQILQDPFRQSQLIYFALPYLTIEAEAFDHFSIRIQGPRCICRFNDKAKNRPSKMSKEIVFGILRPA